MKIEIKHIVKSFGDNNILKDVSFELKKGKIHVLVGTNGCGKTTLFNILTGFQKAEKGTFFLNADNMLNKEPHLINAKGISRTFQNLRLINGLTVKENVMLSFKEQDGEKWWQALLPKNIYCLEQTRNHNKANEILHQTFINDIANQKAGEISYGQQKLLTLACCIANDAQLFLLDEPVAGINPVVRDKLVFIIKALSSQGKTFLIIEHNTDFITQVANKILFLNEGKISEYDTYQLMRMDERVKEAFV